MTTHPRAVAGIVIGTVFVAIAVFVFLPQDIGGDWPIEKFASETWKSQPPNQRYRFGRDLIQSKILLGKAPAEVISILGDPSYRDPGDRYYSYVVRDPETGVGGLNVVEMLTIFFEENGKVTRVVIRSD